MDYESSIRSIIAINDDSIDDCKAHAYKTVRKLTDYFLTAKDIDLETVCGNVRDLENIVTIAGMMIRDLREDTERIRSLESENKLLLIILKTGKETA